MSEATPSETVGGIRDSPGYFITDTNQPRQRRASDAVGIGFGILLLVWGGLTADAEGGLLGSMADFAQSAPSWGLGIARFLYSLSLAYLIVLVFGIAWRGRRSLDTLRDIALAVAVAAVVATVATRIDTDAWPAVIPELTNADIDPAFPVFRVALVTAIAVVTTPHLTRPVRRANGLIVAAVSLASLTLAYGSVGQVIGGIGVGLAAGSAVLLIFGSPAGHPDPDLIRDAVRELGMQLDELTVRDDDSWGARYLDGKLSDGTAVEVKALGRDATGAAASSRFWRTLWYRGGSGPGEHSRIGSLEHEAMVNMFATRTGISTAEIRAIGTAGDDMAIIVSDRPGRPLGDVDTADLTDALIDSLWQEINLMATKSIVHGRISEESVLVVGDSVTFADFSAGSVIPETATAGGTARDVANALMMLANRIGVQRAVSSANSALRKELLAEAMPYVQLPAMNRTVRSWSTKPKDTVKALGTELATQLDVDPPPPAKIRRVRLRTILMLLLVLVAANALMGMLTGIDFAAVAQNLQDANWAWIIVGFVVGSFVFFPEATGMLYAVGYSLPLRPLVILQVSVKFIGLAVPSAAGRIAMNAAFLRKYGVSPTIATTQGAVDGIGGFAVEAGILLLAMMSDNFELDLELGGVAWNAILAIVLLVGICVIVAVWRIRKLHDLVIPILSQAIGLFREVLSDPRRAGGVLGSNAASRLVLAITLWFILLALDQPVSLATALVVTVATNLLAGLVPIPGGVGVAEATLTALLILVGVPEDGAFTAAVVFRVCTFYIPAVAGFFATRWLENRDYL